MSKQHLKSGIFKKDGTEVSISQSTLDKIEDVDGFLDSRLHDPKGILIGPKGAGKSLLLRTRAWINQSKLGTRSIPSGGRKKSMPLHWVKISIQVTLKAL